MSRMAGEPSECLEHHVQGPEGAFCAQDRIAASSVPTRERMHPHRLPGWICFFIFVAGMRFPVTER